MRRLAIYLVSVFILILALAPRASFAQDSPRPNILVFVADDVDWRDYGAYGNDAIHTPNIDALAAGGLLCRNAFLTTSQCSPSRISILTGRYPHATGAEDLHMPLPAAGVLVPTHLKQQGYFTGHMRKTHYGREGERQFDWYSEDLSSVFPDFLDEAGDAPFFMWVGFRDAHRSYEEGAFDPPHDPAKVFVPPYLADTPETRKDLAMYYDEVARLDGQMGRFKAELDRRGLTDDTLIVFLGDNGAPFPRAKGSAYDSGMGTPLIFHWPAVIKPGVTHEGLASVIDLAPTFLEIAGLAKPDVMQGRSMLDVLKDPTRPGREFAFSERNWHNCDEHIRTVRTTEYRLLRNAYLDVPHGTPADIGKSPSWRALLALKEEGKLTKGQAMLFEVPRPELELFDIKADPWQLNNVASDPAYADVLRELTSVLEHWSTETEDFSPDRRRRADNTDRFTGVKFTRDIAPMVE